MKRDIAVNSGQPSHRRLTGAAVKALVILVSVLAQHSQACSQQARELHMTVSADPVPSSMSKVPKFRVELQNVGDHDLILNLGMMLANGHNQYPNAMVLMIIDRRGKMRQFELKGPGLIAGRADPLIVPLPVGTTFSIPVDLDKYWAASAHEFDYRFEGGAYSLQARFTGRAVSLQNTNLDVKGLALMPYWIGSIVSNQLRFEVGK